MLSKNLFIEYAKELGIPTSTVEVDEHFPNSACYSETTSGWTTQIPERRDSTFVLWPTSSAL